MNVQQPSADLVWDDPTSFHFETNTLIITAFHINPMLTNEEVRSELDKVLLDINIRFKPWIDHYIWDSTPIFFKLAEKNGTCFIYGELVIDESLVDEWLVTSILFDLSKTYPDLYVHLRDNDGEILLIEGHESLPEWLSPEASSNRDWINHGRIFIIPEEYYQDRGLKLHEALKFLEKAVYKCFEITDLNASIQAKISKLPKEALQNQVELELRVPRKTAGFLLRNNILKSVLSDYNSGEGSIGNTSPETSSTIDKSDWVHIKIRSTTLCHVLIQISLGKEKLTDFENNGGELVSLLVEDYVKENDLQYSYIPTDEELKIHNNRGDVLQDELIRLCRIDEYVQPSISLIDDITNDDDDNNADENELLTRLENFFKDTNAGLEGVDNKDDKTGETVPDDVSKKIEEIESDSSTDSDDPDEVHRKFLKEQKIDIDEDDFFEFFAKEALKLSDKDLEGFVNLSVNDHNDEEASQDQQDEDSDSDGVEDANNISADEIESLAELLKSLKEGGDFGPAATFLQNLKG